jgi:hypothetical protein
MMFQGIKLQIKDYLLTSNRIVFSKFNDQMSVKSYRSDIDDKQYCNFYMKNYETS